MSRDGRDERGVLPDSDGLGRPLVHRGSCLRNSVVDYQPLHSLHITSFLFGLGCRKLSSNFPSLSLLSFRSHLRLENRKEDDDSPAKQAKRSSLVACGPPSSVP